MRILLSKLFSAFGVFCVLAAAIQAQTFTLGQTAIANGGMSDGAGGSFGLSSTTGQAGAGNSLRGNPYSMTVGFWNYDSLAPTAANASISGRVTTANGQGIRNARLVLTDSSGARRYEQSVSFGYFRFSDLPTGESYVLTVYSKRFVFTQPSQILILTEDLTDVNFTGEP